MRALLAPWYPPGNSVRAESRIKKKGRVGMKEVERVVDKGYSDRVMNHPEHISSSHTMCVCVLYHHPRHHCSVVTRKIEMTDNRSVLPQVWKSKPSMLWHLCQRLYATRSFVLCIGICLYVESHCGSCSCGCLFSQLASRNNSIFVDTLATASSPLATGLPIANLVAAL